jgi:hypothetical protein
VVKADLYVIHKFSGDIIERGIPKIFEEMSQHSSRSFQCFFGCPHSKTFMKC